MNLKIKAVDHSIEDLDNSLGITSERGDELINNVYYAFQQADEEGVYNPSRIIEIVSESVESPAELAYTSVIVGKMLTKM